MVDNRTSSSATESGEERQGKISELERQLVRRREQLVIGRHVFVFSTMLLLFSIFLVTVPENFTELFAPSRWDISKKEQWVSENVYLTTLIGIIIFVLSTTGFAYLYATGFPIRRFNKALQGNAITTEEGFDNTAALSIVDALQRVNRSIEEGKLASVLSESERNDIIEKLADVVDQQLNDTLMAKIEEKYGLEIRNEIISDDALQKSTLTVDRLKSTTDELQKKAVVYLFYGLFAAILGLGVFTVFIYTVSIPEGISSVGQVFYYTSRITLVLLIEAFAFFFFNLYKSTLGDVKFMTNEVTNAETKIIALTSALKLGDRELMNEILTEFAKSERNFILKKGETSIFHDAVRDRFGTKEAIERVFEKMPWRPDKQQ